MFSQIAKKYQCIPKKHIITCVVEWPMASQYKFGKLDPVYLLWHRRKLLDYHWELSKKIDAGSSNTLIEQIFSSIEELVDGKLVCGAGGGGFLQVILKKGVTRQMVEERLKEVFMDSLVGVADCRLVWE